jgi:hypothetical protein
MSKLILFDFECKHCGSVFEELVYSNVRKLNCECGKVAKRIISGTHLDYTGMALSGEGMETAIDKFDRGHRERKAIEERTYAEHGDYGKSAYGH